MLPQCKNTSEPGSKVWSFRQILIFCDGRWSSIHVHRDLHRISTMFGFTLHGRGDHTPPCVSSQKCPIHLDCQAAFAAALFGSRQQHFCPGPRYVSTTGTVGSDGGVGVLGLCRIKTMRWSVGIPMSFDKNQTIPHRNWWYSDLFSA